MDLRELEAWFRERPKWLQDAAHRLVQHGILTEQDFSDLLAICMREVDGEAVTFEGLPAGALSIRDTTEPLRLMSIGNVQGINALAPTRPLEFGNTPLCIVYGRNGTGKSGYVRLLKHACGARHAGELLGNIFVPSAEPQAAEFTFTEDTKTKVCQWTGKPIPELQGVEIYDTACGLVYVNEENEVAFEPGLLRLFTQLTDACTGLSQRIKAQIVRQVSRKPVFPVEYTGTSAATWYASITSLTTAKEVNDQTAWRPEDEAALTEVGKRLAETNPTEKAAALRRQKAFLLELRTDLQAHYEALTQARCETYLWAKVDAATKRRASDEDAKQVFEKAPLAGIGSESWRLLWEAARRYSEEHAYKAVAFPNLASGARCVLCQQELDQASRDRFVSFENFVRGELQRLASEAEQALQKAAASFSEIPTTETLAVKMEAAGIAEGPVRAGIADFASTLATRRQTCLAAQTLADISRPPSPGVLSQLDALAGDIERQIATCDEDVKGQNRPALEQRRKELSARKWLYQQREAIDDEIIRLRTVKRLEEMDRLTSTKALSTRKSILTDELITNAYIKRFQDELTQLNASPLAVELKKTRAQVGRVYHRISLRNAVKEVRTSDILSEGEFRIVSLAAFLADSKGRGGRTPFIFDDPISSLDHVYEDTTARRLVELSQTRQVIIFTHRLSLVGLLEKYAEKQGIKACLICLSRYLPGEITDLPIDLKRTDRAANYLKNERLPAAKKALAEGDVTYENEVKALCRDIRVLLERVIEMDLINGVVRRFSQELNTKGKMHALAKITEADCQFVDRYMTKYSSYEHSHPEEAPAEWPKPSEIESDLTELSAFVEKIRQRNASA